MKKSIISCLAISAMIAMSACKDMKPNDALIEQIKDSIKKIYPTPYTSVGVKEHSDVTIILGSEALYNGPEEKRVEVKDALAKIAVHYLEENNYLDEGNVIFVPNERTVPTDDDPKKEYKFEFEPLLKKK